MSGPTVLIVEDDETILALLEMNFEMAGFDVLTAADGQRGLERARVGAPDVVVADVMLPGLSGIEMVETLKHSTSTRDIPVVLLSAKALPTDVRAGLDAGADDYVTKPFEPLDLVDRANTLLSR